jgi:hypothetical protein
MYINLCTAPSDDHATVSRLTGAAHVAVKEEDARKEAEDDAEQRQSGLRPVQSREVCNNNKEWISIPSSGCQHSVQLSTQMLRTCRQAHLDAALLPYSTNTFHFSRALSKNFCDAFAEKFSLKQRRAIQTAIVYTLSLRVRAEDPRLASRPQASLAEKHWWVLVGGLRPCETPESGRRGGSDGQTLGRVEAPVCG